MEKQKTKLGARILSAGELNAILPNAESVFGQIDMFRNNISRGNSNQNSGQYEIEQITNNIGIMGGRGTGKTSILKTYCHQLKNGSENGKGTDKNKKTGDVILPIIIPENMSVGTTLMDAVLGRLKSIVEERERENEKDRYQGECIYSGCDSLEKQYNEMVKQYCYIKKDYRDILIQEFTTEQNYVDKTKKVFSSDSEFIKLFHQFVDNLLRRDAESMEKGTEKNPLLLLFIDDVDLSVNRCMDIARTLLVYLSHPRIVTFISGDMSTFEEELTLEFLRQEGALREDVFRKTYYSANDGSAKSSLLERKKILAYEYLKKIIPPAYRREIRYWALEERGNYRIEGDGSKSLTELLIEVTKEKVNNQYFVYTEDGEEKCMRLAFHMFDDTARGLNNVYNVLQEIYDIQTGGKDMTEGQKTLLFWRLIETMVDSKSLYANHKSDLLTKIIVLGQEQVKIDFENAYQLLYGEDKEKKEGDEEHKVEEVGGRKSKDAAEKLSAKDRFAIFYLIDFAARLFLQEKRDGEDFTNYKRLEKRIIQEYLSDETIEDKIAPERELLDCLGNGGWRSRFLSGSVQWILFMFITESDFVVALHLIQYIGRADIYALLGKGRKVDDEKSVAYDIAYALLRAIRAVSGTEECVQGNLVDLYEDMWDTMRSLLDKLSLNPWIIFGRLLIANTVVENGSMRFMQGDNYNGRNLSEASFWNVETYIRESMAHAMQPQECLWAEYESRNSAYWIYYENRLRDRRSLPVRFNLQRKAKEMILEGRTKSIMNLLHEQDVMDQYEVRALKDVNYDGLLEGKSEEEKRKIEVIEQIDKRGLWDSVYVEEFVSTYLKKRVKSYVYGMGCGRIIFDATQFVTEAYAALVNCDKGSTGNAIIYGVESKIRRILFLSDHEGDSKQGRFSDGKYYLRLEQALIIWCLLEEFLNTHSGAYYGRKEAKKLLMEVRELPLLLHTEKWNAVDEELRKREDAFFEINLELSRDSEGAKVKKSERWKAEIENIRKIWYEDLGCKGKDMDILIREQLGEAEGEDYRYVKYLVQKKQIDHMKIMWKEKDELRWNKIEPLVLVKDYLFAFHSYLRYLQVDDEDAKSAGAWAEEIVRLAEYVLDSEIKYGETILKDFYQMISEELTLTEEEFENLFYISE